jgi:hypothetical protein
MKTRAGVQGVILFLCCLALVACHLEGYSRSYTISAEDKFGQRVALSFTATPPQVPAVAARLRSDGVIAADVPVVVREVEREALDPAAEQLAVLTLPVEEMAAGRASAPGPGREREREVLWPPDTSDPVVYLMKDGMVEVTADAVEIAKLRAAGWMDVPRRVDGSLVLPRRRPGRG